MALGTPQAFSANTGTSLPGSLVATLPASIANGSAAFMLCNVNSAVATTQITTPTGWTLVAGPDDIPTFGNELVYVFARSVGAAQSSTNVTVSLVGTVGRQSVVGAVIPGASATLDNTAVRFYGASETSSALTVGAHTPVTADDMQLLLVSRRWPGAASTPLTTSPPSGFTEIEEGNHTTNATGSVLGSWGAYRQLSGQAGVSQGTKTITLDSASNGHGYSLMIKPSVTSSAPVVVVDVLDAVLLNATGSTVGSGDTASYSITQNTGTTYVPVLISAGKWLIERDTAGTRTYTVTVTGSPSGLTNTYPISVNTASAGADNIEEMILDGSTLI